MARLPILLSIPHGGTEIPPEVQDRVIISPADLFDDGDAYTREIYNLGDGVAAVISANVARAFVDLNRAPNDLPPGNPDGVIKSHTCYRKLIYRAGLEPDEMLLGLTWKAGLPCDKEALKIREVDISLAGTRGQAAA